MSTVSFSTIRDRFSDAIGTISGFSLSRNPFDGYGRSPNSVAHQRYAVGIQNSAARTDDRQRLSTGIMSDTSVMVTYPFRIRPKDQVSSYDDALDSAESVIQKIVNRSSPLHDNLTIRYTGMDNELSDAGEYIRISLTFNILHYLPLN